MQLMVQLDVTSSQLLVTENDFKDPEFRKQLTETVNTLLRLRVIPVFNENDAMSTRKAPYEVFPWTLNDNMYNSSWFSYNVTDISSHLPYVTYVL